MIRGGVAGVIIVSISTFVGEMGPVISGLLLSLPTTISTTGWALNGHYGLDFVAATCASARKALVLYILVGLTLLGLLQMLPGPMAVVVVFVVIALIGAIFAALFMRKRR